MRIIEFGTFNVLGATGVWGGAEVCGARAKSIERFLGDRHGWLA